MTTSKLLLLGSLMISGLTPHLQTQAQSKTLKFDQTTFVSEAPIENNANGRTKISQTYSATEASPHGCSIVVTQRSDMTVEKAMQFDKTLAEAASAAAPIKLFNHPKGATESDRVSVSFLKNRTDNSKFTVILHRATKLEQGMIQEIRITCTGFSYDGPHTRKITEFQNVETAWVNDLFGLNP